MTQSHISWIIKLFSDHLNHEYDPFVLHKEELNIIDGGVNDVSELIIQLNQTAARVKVVFMEHTMEKPRLLELVRDLDLPVLVFREDNSEITPAIIRYDRKQDKLQVFTYQGSTGTSRELGLDFLKRFISDSDGKILYMTAFVYESLVSEQNEHSSGVPLTPVERLFRLLSN